VLTKEEIAQHLWIVATTAKAYFEATFTKLDVTSCTQAIVSTLKFGLVQA
jgi:DNA-binding NarL/FixJ family response regulator